MSAILVCLAVSLLASQPNIFVAASRPVNVSIATSAALGLERPLPRSSVPGLLSLVRRMHRRLVEGLGEGGSTQEDFFNERCGPTPFKGLQKHPDFQPELKELHPKVAGLKSMCPPGVHSLGDRLVLVARFRENMDWIIEQLTVPFLVYTAGSHAALHSEQIGNEAATYLTYIAEHYDCLPKVTLFAHAHRMSKTHSSHTLDFDANHAQWHKVPGFAFKHRSGLWLEYYNLTHPEDIWQHPVNLTEEELKDFEDCGRVRNGTVYSEGDTSNYLRALLIGRLWNELLANHGFGALPDMVRLSGGAEMFVTKEAVRKNSRMFYLRALSWMHYAREETGLDEWSVGGAFELLWHVVFGQDAYMKDLTIKECDLYHCDPEAEEADGKLLDDNVKGRYKYLPYTASLEQ